MISGKTWARVGVLTLAALATLLAGCAGQVNMVPTLSEETVVQPNQGLVVARVVNASGYPLPFNQLTLDPENLNESTKIKPERLSALTDQRNSSTVFAAPLKSGMYALSSIRAFHSNGNFWYSRFASTTAKFGTFEVSPGQVTDLGTIIYYPKSQGDRYVNMLLRRPAAEPADTLQRYFPFYDFDLDAVSGWDRDERDMERNTAYVSAARNPVTYNDKYLAPDGSLYFVGKLGIIIKRDPQGDWLLDAVDTNIDLHTVAASERGDLVVAGEEGKVFVKPAGGEWQDRSIDHRNYIHQALFTDDNRVDLLTSRDSLLSVMRGSGDGDWQTVASFRAGYGWYDANNDITFSTASDNSGKRAPSPRDIDVVSLKRVQGRNELFIRTLARYESHLFSNGRLETFLVEPETWRITGSGNTDEYSSVINAGNTQLAIKEAGFWSWDGKPDFLRLNRENNRWEEITTRIRSCPGDLQLQGGSCDAGNGREYRAEVESFSFSSTPWFKNSDEAIAIALFREKSAETGEYERVPRIIETSDGGKHWSKTDRTLPARYCGTLIPDLKDHLLLTCKGGSSDFYESFDEGETWQHVRQHENF